jgi:hypothetical protein
VRACPHDLIAADDVAEAQQKDTYRASRARVRGASTLRRRGIALRSSQSMSSTAPGLPESVALDDCVVGRVPAIDSASTG